ncbi:MAG: LPS-assembly protein LptD [Gammaproteobacteria bacterium]|uniref:LPS-assembly protein LptD n=1 Tax=Limnobacter sp. TaxID=2003368 RepID=UPI001D5562F1|nr:LPS-assembly protein LptD [Limnobacter sp.]MBU0783914.1 LPS-assembly protein LptD [Gammaproteobacteria bacterium]MBU0848810.1 LPS-assembly protein LptD [Gammaproteobacteria bacterium]MBU1266492.1 LPS-assembly protein LptD [Gammaproteobacteria bacterium]MBU1528172.1 LPS-assembly protein LptD [Gammaproteobacteria bacterium]MBU1778977.1 LPS-assembly protein LptD [Gammaproteobacteria bacterium]
MKKSKISPLLHQVPARQRILALALFCIGSTAFAQNAENQPQDAENAARLKIDGGLLGVRSPIPEDEATYISADKLYGNSAEETFLEGNVEVRRNKLRLFSDSINYSPITDKATAKGNLIIEQEGMVLRAPEGSVKLGTGESQMTQPTFELKEINGKGRADKLQYDGISTLTLENPNYTVCEVPNPGAADQGDWYITADSLEIDQASEVGRARGAKVVFQDVPILGAPYFSFPTTDRRKSGFLPPSFGTVSNSGLEVTVPYYLNIAPDKDMTLYPKVISGRGFQLGTQTRYLTPNNEGELKYDYLPNDEKTGTDRSALSLLHSFEKGPFYAGVNFNQVSDDNYFVDFSRTQAVASQRVLVQEGFLSYRQKNWSANVRTVAHQTLQLFNDVIAEPYDRLPEATVELSPTRIGNANAFVSVSGQYTDFARPSSAPARVEGSRGVTRARVFMPIQRSEFSFTPAFSLQTTTYDLKGQTTGMPAAPGSVIPTVSLDSTVYFDRKTRFFGRNVNQTLEPRIFYLYTPFKDQSDQPIFDTSVTDQSLSRIFAENRYSGLDRVGDANQLTLAVTSRFYDDLTSEELFSVTGGQRLNLNSPRVILQGFEAPTTSDSDFFANARGRISQSVFLDATSQLNAESGRHERGNVTVSYAPSLGKQLNFGYRYTRAQIDQFDISGQWPISDRWSGVGRLNYSMLDNRLIEGVAGLEYSEGCWAVRVIAQRFATAPQLETSSLFVQLELTGLGRLGSNPADLLSRKVPGYTPFSSSQATR